MKIPFLIRTYSKIKLDKNLGFQPVDFNEIYFPNFKFLYISPGGNSSLETNIVLDVNNLDKFVRYISDILVFKKSIKGQRSLMTLSLRSKIKERDKYTCQKCGISLSDEPNLLLEIDHICPLSKGGKTIESNLQTLCWKCNRTKGSKIENNVSNSADKEKNNFKNNSLDNHIFCVNCGNKINKKDSFCRYCGYKL